MTRLGRDIEGHNPRCSTLYKHLHETLANEPTGACDDAVFRHGRERCFGEEGHL